MSLRKVRDSVRCSGNPRAVVDDSHYGVFQWNHEHEKCNSNQEIVDELETGNCVPGGVANEISSIFEALRFWDE